MLHNGNILHALEMSCERNSLILSCLLIKEVLITGATSLTLLRSLISLTIMPKGNLEPRELLTIEIVKGLLAGHFIALNNLRNRQAHSQEITCIIQKSASKLENKIGSIPSFLLLLLCSENQHLRGWMLNFKLTENGSCVICNKLLSDVVNYNFILPAGTIGRAGSFCYSDTCFNVAADCFL